MQAAIDSKIKNELTPSVQDEHEIEDKQDSDPVTVH